MTSAWKNTNIGFALQTPFANHCKLSPNTMAGDHQSNGRNSVVSDPGYSSAANSVSADYGENDMSYLDAGEISPSYSNFVGQSSASFNYQNDSKYESSQRLVGGFNQCHSDYSRLNHKEFESTLPQNNVLNSSKAVSQNVAFQNNLQVAQGKYYNDSSYTWKNFINDGTLRPPFLNKRSRSTSGIQEHQYTLEVPSNKNMSSHSPSSIYSSSPNERKDDQIIPTISVDECWFANESVFREASSSNATLASNNNYTNINKGYARSGNYSAGSSPVYHTQVDKLQKSTPFRLPSSETYDNFSNSNSVSPGHQLSPSRDLQNTSQTTVTSPVTYSNFKDSLNVKPCYKASQQQSALSRNCDESDKMTIQNQPRKSQYSDAEDDTWKSYLEHPLTAANTALINESVDGTSNSDLGLLYDYYKVPQDKRVRTCQLLNSIESDFESNKDENINQVTTESLAVTSLNGIQSSIVTSSLATGRKQNNLSLLTTSESSFMPTEAANVSFTQEDRFNPTLTTINSIPNHVYTKPEFHQAIDFEGYDRSNAQSSLDIFEYIMEAPRSLKQKDTDPTMSYINKGQFYCITLRDKGKLLRKSQSTKVRSVVQIIFGDSKPEEEQLRHWRYWHARQHTAKQRIIDIADYKESNMIYDIEEIAHNAIAFSWDTNDVARIYISCNCLSTDFSAQKGIKGLPLLLQIDTYEEEKCTGTPTHRGVCQIKVFCDKGAERKIRDEERKALRKSQKKQGRPTANNYLTLASAPTNTNKSNVKGNLNGSAAGPKKMDDVYFKTSTDLLPPVYFQPDVPDHGMTPNSSHMSFMSISPSPSLPSPTSSMDSHDPNSYSRQRENSASGTKRSHSVMTADEISFACSPKIARTESSRKVLLYVRNETEEVFNGLMLNTPDLNGLKLAIEEKYSYAASDISKVFKKSKKGITVNMDDNIIQHYSNEDTFIIDIQPQVTTDGSSTYYVILTEV